jgi:hypothetical protein
LVVWLKVRLTEPSEDVFGFGIGVPGSVCV